VAALPKAGRPTGLLNLRATAPADPLTFPRLPDMLSFSFLCTAFLIRAVLSLDLAFAVALAWLVC
jgi:hypothetical protein